MSVSSIGPKANPDDLRIEKSPYRVKVYLGDGETMKGEVYLSECSPSRRGGETLIELANDPERDFLPFREHDRNGVHSLNRSWILMIETGDPKMVDLDGLRVSAEPAFAPVVLQCGIRGGDPFVVRGLLYLKRQPPGKRRTADVLNGPEPFVLVRLERGSYGLVNKARVCFAYDG
jgi:hypothetical protein